MDQIQIDRNNTIQNRDQIKMAMPIWSVGQGGCSAVSKPHFEGYMLGFGYSEYTFDEGATSATGFKLNTSDERDRFISVIRPMSIIKSSPISKAELASMNIRDGLKPDVDYALGKGRLVVSLSLMDRNIEGGGYNNWYLCDSEEKAMAVYEEMLSNWTAEHEKEANRARYILDDRDW